MHYRSVNIAQSRWLPYTNKRSALCDEAKYVMNNNIRRIGLGASSLKGRCKAQQEEEIARR
jgi:hypothetical protein